MLAALKLAEHPECSEKPNKVCNLVILIYKIGPENLAICAKLALSILMNKATTVFIGIAELLKSHSIFLRIS